MILGLTDLDSCFEGGLVYPSKEIAHMGAWVDARVTIVLDVLHLLVDLLVRGNKQLEVIVLVLAPVSKIAQLFFELNGTTLGKPRAKERGLKFLEGGMNVAGLVKLIYAHFSRGLFYDQL